MTSEQTNQKTILLDVDEFLIPSDPETYYVEHQVVVPDGAVKVGLEFTYFNPYTDTNPNQVVCFIAFFDPKGFRGQRMNPGGRGEVKLELWTAPDEASEGAIPGEMTPGTWTVLIDIRALSMKTSYKLNFYAIQSDEIPAAIDIEFINDHVMNPQAGWYKGELHAHSTESDGRFTVKEVVEAAIDYGLDFYSLTDHTTCSQWHKLAKLQNSKMAIIKSMEITSHLGHANLHGLDEWVDAYIDRPGWSANQAAEEVHRQGGLFCVNHAFSGHLAWRDFDLDWSLVDLEEIYHNLEAANNSYQLSLWDHHLLQGYRIVGVGGIDSHNPFEGIHELGQVVTWVYADNLSQKGIIDGLRRGQVYISRGPEIRFTAKNQQGSEATMWESLNNDGSITLLIDVKWDQPLNLFIIKNGLILDLDKTESNQGDWQQISYVDHKPIAGSYYRIELHDDDGVRMPYRGIIWRDYSTTRVLTNPIWVN